MSYHENTLLLTNIASKICSNICDNINSYDDINETLILNEFNHLISNDYVTERLISMNNNIFSKKELIDLINDSESQTYITSVVKNYLIKKNVLI